LPGAVSLNVVKNFSNLRRLTVSSTQLTDDELLVDIATCCVNLERLAFIEDRIDIIVRQQTGNDMSVSLRI